MRSITERPTVIVVDDHDLFRGGLVSLLAERGVSVVGEAALASEAIALAVELDPDVVLMDLSMPGMSGVEATQRLSVAAPRSRIIALTVMSDDRAVMEALLAGASGYLLKDATISQIVDGIRAVADGESIISPSVANLLVQRVREPHGSADVTGADLTPREQEILALLARGLDNHEIAAALHLSPHTIKNYVSSTFIKLQVENRVQAAVRAVRGGMV